MVDSALFSSSKDEWETPQEFFDLLDAEFHFTLDPCATAENAKCETFYDESDNGLSCQWFGIVFVNPPYGQIKDWVMKSYFTARDGYATVVLLIPSRTDTAYWHDYIMKATEIRFVRGRLKFVGGKSSAPFPSAVVIFRPGKTGHGYVPTSSMGRRSPLDGEVIPQYNEGRGDK